MADEAHATAKFSKVDEVCDRVFLHEETGGSTAPHLLPLSAKSPEALMALARAYEGFLSSSEDPLSDIAYTASVRRSHHEHRMSVVCASREEALVSLASVARGEALREVAVGVRPLGARPKVVFVFSGQGSHWLGMGRELLAEEEVFRQAIEACDQAIQSEMGLSVLDELRAAPEASRLGETDVVQPVLFAIGVGLSALWQSWGVEPNAVVGHSVGEVTAAFVGGALSLGDAVRVIACRSRLMRRMSGRGAVALVELGPKEAVAALEGNESRVVIGGCNGPRATVLSGDRDALEEVLQRLSARGVFHRLVKMDVASHSPQMDGLREELLAGLRGIVPRPLRVPMCSTVTTDFVEGTDLCAEYWARNLREPVLFADAVARLLSSGHRLFVEMSAHPVLTSAVAEALDLAAVTGAALCSLRRGREEKRSLLSSLGALYAHGYELAWERLHPSRGRCVLLPTYPWQRKRYWLENVKTRPPQAAGHPLLGASISLSTDPQMRLWEQTLGSELLPYLADHGVEGEVVLPAAATIEMAFAAARASMGPGPFAIEQTSFDRMLTLPANTTRTVQLSLRKDGEAASYRIASREDAAGEWVEHSRGNIRIGVAQVSEGSSLVEESQKRCTSSIEAKDLYERLSARGLEYGPAFQGIERLWYGPDEALAQVRLSQPLEKQASSYSIHPALLDACFQVAAAILAAPGAGDRGVFVPIALQAMRLYRRPLGEIWVHARIRTDTGAKLVNDITLLDADGQVIAECVGLTVARLDPSPGAQEKRARNDALYEIAWRRRELAPRSTTKGASGAWLILEDRSGAGAALASRLEAHGEACVRVTSLDPLAAREPGVVYVDPTAPDAFESALQDIFIGRTALRGVVHLASLDAAPTDVTTEETLATDIQRSCLSALYLAQAIVRRAPREAPRLWLVTRGALSTGNAEEIAVAEAPLWGLGRVIALEHPELRCSAVDLPRTRTHDEIDPLFREILSDDAETQVALRPDGRYVARLSRGAFANPEDAAPEPTGDRSYRLEISEPGTLDRLTRRETSRRPPGPNEVEIEVEYASLNFIDVLKALGLYPGLDKGTLTFGGECSGRIVRIGDGVERLSLGQEVIALAPCSVGTHVTTRACFVVPRPPTIGAAEASAALVVLMTAWYALYDIGRLQQGERVLIHSAAGGVGLAAMQLARRVGAEIYATAGTPEKRALLRELGAVQVMDSRSLSFAEELLEHTQGQGVDLVLNSLGGEAIDKGLSTLAHDGRFIEIGKRDIYADRPLGLAHFRKNLSYAAVDLLGLADRKPALVSSLLRRVVDELASGRLEPLPCEVFPISRVEDAFRVLSQGNHIGKLVIAMRDPSVTIARAACSVRSDATYLITGGLGGLGLSLAAWMVQEGARHLVLAGRSGLSEATRPTIEAMQAAGADVQVMQVDVARRRDLAATMTQIAKNMPPLRGIVHAAGVLDDRTMLELDAERFTRVLVPKVQGAWNLYALARDLPLDFFVLYSSAASILGSPGQGNYAAANAFLDALAHHARAGGVPAISVNWGLFAGVGMAASRGRVAGLLQAGAESLTPAEGQEALGRLFAHPRAQAGVFRLNLRAFFDAQPRAAASTFWSELHDGSAPARGTSLRAALADAKPADRREMLETRLLEMLGRILRLSPSQIARTTTFRSLGFDSLMNVELRNQLESTLGLKLSVSLLFTHETSAALAEELLGRIDFETTQESDTHESDAPESAPVVPSSALSYGERALWFIQQMSPESSAYHLSIAFRARAGLDVRALFETIEELVLRHAPLHTAYVAEDHGPTKRARADAHADIAVVDGATWSEDELAEELEREANRPFALHEGSTLRARIFTRSGGEHVLLLTMHHIAVDLVSIELLLEEIGEIYTAKITGAPIALPPIDTTYTDFVAWQARMLAGAQGEQHWAYWQEQLRGAPMALDLTTDRPRPAGQTYRGATYAFALDPRLTERIKELAQTEGSTLYTVLLTAFQILLHRSSGQRDILVGSPVLGRNREELERVVGYLVNLVALRARFDDEPTVKELLDRSAKTVLGALEHQDYPFPLLVERLAPERDPSRSPIFQFVFTLRRPRRLEEFAPAMLGESGIRLSLGALEFESIALPERSSQFDMNLTMLDHDGAIGALFQYNTDLFDEATIARMAGHFRTLLEGMVEAPERRISELPLLTQTERRQIIEDWNDARVDDHDPRTLHELFEAQVAQNPEAIAVVLDEESLSYRELDQRANRLAHRLRSEGVGPEARVGLCVERSFHLIVGILGVLKAGGAYVPMDPSYPRERLRFVLEDCGAQLVLTERALEGRLPEHEGRTLYIDEESAKAGDVSKPYGKSSSNDLAYVIYTSGSTGKPKGVEVTHGNVTRLFHATRAWFHFDASDVWTLFHSYAFDFSVWEIWGALLHGGRLVVVPYATSRSPDAFRRLLASEGVTVLNQTPSAFRQLDQADERAEDEMPLSLRFVIFGGEALEVQSLRPWFERHGDESPRLVNMYGITETTVHVTYRPLSFADLDAPTSPIGRAIPDLQVYVLDQHRALLPVGVAGELYVGGAGVARGYLNRPELTAERFIVDPFRRAPDARLYKTGDLCRWRADGQLEYLGRIDHQVKIRGYRIELGEIEGALAKHPLVREAVVLAREDTPGDKRLVAYVVGEDAQASELREHLKAKLPDYMVPSAFMLLPVLPLTPNGKVDRRLLPAPDQSYLDPEEEIVAPTTPTEERLADIWIELLSVERIGVHNNFFALGGHSLLAMQMISRIHSAFDVELSMSELFESPTIRALSEIIETALWVDTPQLDEADVADIYGFEAGAL